MTAKYTFLALGALLSFGAPVLGQSNVKHGVDVKVGSLGNLKQMGHQGTPGTGVSALAMDTTACNNGSVTVPWQQPMDPDHPLIAFLIVSERNGRMEQISNLSHVKHGFFALTSSLCTPCQGGDPFGGTFLGIGCSDTYSTNNNGDNYWLGPNEEIDPWLGEWDPVCSLFDQGLNPQPSTMCDGSRSFTNAQANSLGPLGFRVLVRDEDINPTPGREFYYQCQYVIEHEHESLREDNLASREFTVAISGSTPFFNPQGGMLHGSVLGHWTGASLSSGLNGNADGRFYVAVKVTGPEAGLYHYEYAVHNRDNARAGGALRLPICSDAQVLNPSFRDLDQFAPNDWTFSQEHGELVFQAQGDPLRWNSIFNFSFDSDAAPAAGIAEIDEFFPGAGADRVQVPTTVPGDLYNMITGPGCSNGAAPALFATGTPPQASLGNTSFALSSTGNDPGALTLLLLGGNPGTTDLGNGCILQMGGAPTGIINLGTQFAGFDGTVSHPVPIPNAAGLQGKTVLFQMASMRASGGPFLGQFDFSNGLAVRLGDSLSACP